MTATANATPMTADAQPPATVCVHCHDALLNAYGPVLHLVYDRVMAMGEVVRGDHDHDGQADTCAVAQILSLIDGTRKLKAREMNRELKRFFSSLEPLMAEMLMVARPEALGEALPPAPAPEHLQPAFPGLTERDEDQLFLHIGLVCLLQEHGGTVRIDPCCLDAIHELANRQIEWRRDERGLGLTLSLVPAETPENGECRSIVTDGG